MEVASVSVYEKLELPVSGEGALSAVTMPLFGRLFDQHRYDVAFAIAALLPAIGYAAWAWINRGVEEHVRLEVATPERA